MAIPLAFGFLIPVVSRPNRRIADVLGNLVTLCLLVMALALVGRTPLVYKMGGWKPPIGINLVADGFSVLMLIAINLIAFMATLFSISYMERFTDKPKYYGLFMLMVAGMNGVALTGDIFNLYVFLEIASIASYALVAFGCEHEELEASFKYLVLSSVASSFILLGVAIIYSSSGTLNMADLSGLIKGIGLTKAMLFASALFIAGFSLKGGLVPFHAWLPDAHPSAPAPISAMLSGVLIKAVGIYALTRIVYTVLGMSRVFSITLMSLGALSMVVGDILAIGQWDLKRLLAYSSVGHMGYVLLGIGLGTPLGILGGIFHLLNHSVFKSCLFLCSGAIEHETGTRDMRKMGGLWRKMPVTSTSCVVSSLSISGVPPFNGFWSKLIIIIAAIQAKHYGIAAIAVAVAFLTLIAFTKVMRYAVFGSPAAESRKIKEVPAFMCASLIILAILCLGLGISLPIIKPELLEPARQALLEVEKYIQLVLK
jgi:multicomponent Na+:H+ antiporter subunit D